MPGKQAGEDFVLIADLPVCAVRKLSNSLAIASAPEQRQSLRGIDRQRFQQHGVNQAEDRRIGPDAQRQRERGHAGKAGMLQQHPRAITQVLKHFVLQCWETRNGYFCLSFSFTSRHNCSASGLSLPPSSRKRAKSASASGSLSIRSSVTARLCQTSARRGASLMA